MKTVKILLVGIGGWAFHYIDALLDTPCENIKIEGMVDPFPSSCRRLEELLAKNIPLYNTMEEFYAEHSAELAVITTPIQFHTEHILTALKHGSNVLCEKPLCADENDIEKIVEESEKVNRFVDIGYQWSHNEGVLRLKSDILKGIYGKPLSLKNLTLWPRDAAYFNRGCGWAGKLYDAEGRAIFDSVANNATAHHLHNIVFLCGENMQDSAKPAEFDAVLMRTNPIETFDTCVLSGRLENGASFLFAASHAIEKKYGPICEYVFEKGTVRLGDCNENMLNPHFVGYLSDGKIIDYGDPSSELVRKLWLCIEDARVERMGNECCPIRAAAVHTRMINSLHHNFDIRTTCGKLKKVKQDADKLVTYVEGLDKALVEIYLSENIKLDCFFEEQK